MKLKNLQIVSFNNPYPPNYGGVIDVYYKIKYLHQLQVDIYLHIFYEDRLEIEKLKPYCKEIYLYKRNKSLKYFFTKIPFNVSSRSSSQIYNNIIKINAPILFEGLQTTHVLLRNEIKNKIIIRTHNIEHNYYNGLARSETNLFLKLIYYIESYKLKRYESIVNKADLILPLSHKEYEYFSLNYKPKSKFIPVFHGNNHIEKLSQKGEFALYHGDLTTSDNKKAVTFLISIFKEVNQKLIIASSNISKSLLQLIDNQENIQFVKLEKNNKILNELFTKAHVNILYSNQESGTKLKVFNSLFKGRFCIINKNIADDKNIQSICVLANSKKEFIKAIENVFEEDFEQNQQREEVLSNYLPSKLAIRLKEVIEINLN